MTVPPRKPVMLPQHYHHQPPPSGPPKNIHHPEDSEVSPSEPAIAPNSSALSSVLSSSSSPLVARMPNSSSTSSLSGDGRLSRNPTPAAASPRDDEAGTTRDGVVSTAAAGAAATVPALLPHHLPYEYVNRQQPHRLPPVLQYHPPPHLHNHNENSPQHPRRRSRSSTRAETTSRRGGPSLTASTSTPRRSSSLQPRSQVRLRQLSLPSSSTVMTGPAASSSSSTMASYPAQRMLSMGYYQQPAALARDAELARGRRRGTFPSAPVGMHSTYHTSSAPPMMSAAAAAAASAAQQQQQQQPPSTGGGTHRHHMQQQGYYQPGGTPPSSHPEPKDLIVAGGAVATCSGARDPSFLPLLRAHEGSGSVHSAPTAASSTSRGGVAAKASLTPRGSDRGDRRASGATSATVNRRGPSTVPRRDEDEAHTKACRRVIEDLNRAQGSARRVAALTHVCECCDHKDEHRHNIELSLGLLGSLTRFLQGAVQDDEVRMVCSAVEMVLRASPRDVQAAYHKLSAGATGISFAHPYQQPNPLLTNLFRVLERCESNAITHSEVSVLNIAKIFFYLSRCPELRMILCRQGMVLDSLERVGRGVNGSAVSSGGGVTDSSAFYLHVKQAAEVRFYRMRTLANLANVDENKVILLEHQGGALLESILRVSHWDADDSCRQYAASSLMDLASTPANQVAMAGNDKVLGTLVKMALVEKNGVTREFVVTALQNLAFCKENRPRLVQFKDGVLLEALKQALLQDLDAKARRRAAGALTNLVCDETAESLGAHKGLLEALAIVATKDDNWDVQTRAALALTKIANFITVHMDCHGALLDALVVASLSKATNSVSAVLRVKARNPENRDVMARHQGVIDTLTDLCMSVGAAKVSDRDNAIRALMHLLSETENRKILCTKSVLNALVAGANFKERELEEARDAAIKALERLATEHGNRGAMARHPGLLTAVAKAVEREAAWEFSGKESPENGYLAKPLLMSLLVAM